MYVTASHLWQSQLTNGAQVISPPAEACWIAASRTSNSWRQLKLPFKRFWHSEVVKTILAEWGKLRTSWIWVVQSVAYIYNYIIIYIYVHRHKHAVIYKHMSYIICLHVYIYLYLSIHLSIVLIYLSNLSM